MKNAGSAPRACHSSSATMTIVDQGEEGLAMTPDRCEHLGHRATSYPGRRWPLGASDGTMHAP